LERSHRRWRRNLQGAYLEIVSTGMYAPGVDTPRLLLRMLLEELNAGISRALTRSSPDLGTRAYLRKTRHRTRDILDPKQPIAPLKEPGEPSYFPLP
jgi:hypothetical protein